MLISIVIPAFNEELCVEKIYAEILKSVDLAQYSWEILFVDDGSHDSTLERIKELAEKDPRVRYLSFSRNFGHQLALVAGLEHCRGDAVIMMDCDLQHPPAAIMPMIGKWTEGFDIVQGVRRDTDDIGICKRISSALFYRLFRYLTDSNLATSAADFRLISRRVVEKLKEMPEHELFLRGLISWSGFRSIEVGYESGSRVAGKSKYTFRKMLALGVDAILSFSVKPIRVCILAGVATFSLAFAYLIYVLYAKFVLLQAVPGWASIIFLLTLLQGIQFIFIGIIGEYIGRIYSETKRRPRYIVKEMKTA